MKQAERLDRLRAIYGMRSADARVCETGAIQIDQVISTWPYDLRKMVYPATHKLRETAKRLRLQALRADRAIGVILKKHPDLVAAARNSGP